MKDDSLELVRLAEAVADGTPVDWAEASEANRHLESRLTRLRLVEKIGAVHRDLVTDVSFSRAAEVTGPPGPIPETWGHLRIVERLGSGGYGEIFRAWDPKLECEVALKLLHPRFGAAERFMDEARRLARVRHTNVLIVHGVDCHDERVGLWTDLVEGKTLEEAVREQGPFSAEEAALIGIDLCHALAAVHGAGLVHRDIKAANVMRETGGRIVLLDFSAVTDRESTPSMAIPGTPVYMAPELFEGRDSGTAGDIYSLGVLLYRLVSGSYPIQPKGIEDLRAKHREGQAVPLRDARPDLPAGFVQVVERALDPDPRARFASAGEMESALAATLGTVSGETGAAAEGRRGGRRTAWALSAAAVVVLAVAMWMLMLMPRPGAGLDGSAALFRAKPEGDERLLPGASVAPGDSLFLEVTGSEAMHVYVVNQDETGADYVLFPITGLDLQNPLAPGETHRLPGTVDGTTFNWDVTSAGGEELFVVIASLEPLTELELELERVPRAGSALAYPIEESTLTRGLRGIGGLSPESRDGPGEPDSLSGMADRLSNRASSSSGLWVWKMQLRSDSR